ncbi:hypothetical protein CLAFUW4_04203 [Fulvia fulva]|nr:hypothetical protein CLAFUR4_04189 [Fulvia fulva]WPV14303.1 hypothetical protein CLAFUW4_04203 [Fulvia fulva]WPV28757.1 hypothetical protein CLAFUW7_04192 [Fulvia fulva]
MNESANHNVGLSKFKRAITGKLSRQDSHTHQPANQPTINRSGPELWKEDKHIIKV